MQANADNFFASQDVNGASHKEAFVCFRETEKINDPFPKKNIFFLCCPGA